MPMSDNLRHLAIGAMMPAEQGYALVNEIEWHARHRQVLKAATSDNTRRAYRSAVRHFQDWGGPLPCDAAALVRYLMAYAETLNPRTLAVRLTALAQWHRSQGFFDPTAAPDVRKTLTGIERLHGRPKRKAKALPVDDLETIVQSLRGQDTLRALRDNALVQLAFFGAFRRSEIVQIAVADLRWETDGLVVVLPRSKTDQTGQGITKAIPFGDPSFGLLSSVRGKSMVDGGKHHRGASISIGQSLGCCRLSRTTREHPQRRADGAG